MSVENGEMEVDEEEDNQPEDDYEPEGDDDFEDYEDEREEDEDGYDEEGEEQSGEEEEEDGVGDEDDRDPVISEMDVIVDQPSDTDEVYRVQFPNKKLDAFTTEGLKVRYKKNVKMLEMTMDMDVGSTSFDRRKAEQLASLTSGSRTSTGRELDSESYQGKCYKSEEQLRYAAGYFKDDCFHLMPISGTFEMRRSIGYMNNQGKRQQAIDDQDSESTESEGERSQGESGPAPIRVRFSRVETERQKKRREESALHRSKLIEQDPWIPLDLQLDQDPSLTEAPADQSGSASTSEVSAVPIEVTSVDPEEFIHEAIFDQTSEELDLSNSDQLISLRRIRELKGSEQIRAMMIKVRVTSTADAENILYGCDADGASRTELLVRIRESAHLVCGLWVIKSEILYQNDTQTVFRAARDLALALLDADLPVTRQDLQSAFGLSTFHLDSILSTFGMVISSGELRTWALKLPPDANFGKNKEELTIVVEEKRYWEKRWEDIHRYLQAEHERACTGVRRRRSSSRRSSTSGSGGKKRTPSGTTSVVID